MFGSNNDNGGKPPRKVWSPATIEMAKRKVDEALRRDARHAQAVAWHLVPGGSRH